MAGPARLGEARTDGAAAQAWLGGKGPSRLVREGERGMVGRRGRQGSDPAGYGRQGGQGPARLARRVQAWRDWNAWQGRAGPARWRDGCARQGAVNGGSISSIDAAVSAGAESELSGAYAFPVARRIRVDRSRSCDRGSKPQRFEGEPPTKSAAAART